MSGSRVLKRLGMLSRRMPSLEVTPWEKRLVGVKGGRMKIVAANGLLVLLPSAFVLASWANAGRFDGAFYALQGVELLAGAVNFTLLLLNMRDGLRLSGRLTPKRPALASSR